MGLEIRGLRPGEEGALNTAVRGVLIKMPPLKFGFYINTKTPIKQP
jgi:hypothetical protein